MEQELAITREQCINACNDVTDLAMPGCFAFGALALFGGAPGAVAGFVLGGACIGTALY